MVYTLSNKNEKVISLVELFLELEEEIINKIIKGEIFSKLIFELIVILGKRDFIKTYKITKLLLKQFVEFGVIEPKGEKELELLLPWKKNRTSQIMQQLVKEGILLYERRKYLLNLDDPFVKRVKRSIRLGEKDINIEEMIVKFSEKISPIREEHEPITSSCKKEQKSSEKQVYRKATRQEMKQFHQEIISKYSGESFSDNEFVIKESLVSLIKNNILLTIGIVQKEE